MFIVQGPVLIVGKARSGEAVSSLLRYSYPNLEISFYDDKPEKSDFKSHREVLSKRWGHVVLSPGYPDQPWLRELQESGSVFTQELDVAAAYLDTEKIYVITGSVGKSTCAWVAKQALEHLGKRVFLGGNFGVPLAEYALKKAKGDAAAVEFCLIEMSSYQIERMAFMVDRGLILNLYPNHLDRYGDLHKYYAAKLRLMRFVREGLWCVKKGGDLENYAHHMGVESKLRWINAEPMEASFAKSRLVGAHNRMNLAAMLEFLADPTIHEQELLNALVSTESLPHRVELFEHAGLYFANDSKATTIESVLTAYTALRERFQHEKIFWLLGGRDKDLPWHRLKRLWTDKHLSFIFFGESAEHVKSSTGFEGMCFSKLELALSHLKGKILPGELLVLSPGGTSLDEFKNFEERGDFFKATVLSTF